MSPPNEFFARVVESSGLAAIFAEETLLRACERAGVDGRRLTPADLKAALPEFARVLRIFLGAAEANRRMALLSELVIASG